MKLKKIIGQGSEIKALAIVALIIVFAGVDLAISFDQTPINATVNITQAGPEILITTINNGSNVDLTEGSLKEVICNVTIRDYNGYTDIYNVNATLYDYNNATVSSPDDNNDHYSNSSCTQNVSIDANTAVWSCKFNKYYYANNGTWSCYASVNDTTSYYDNDTANYTVNALYAINITNTIDYGNMAVGDTSTTSEIVNISNSGNRQVNLTVFGWGGRNISDTAGDGLAFICEVGNISIDNERFNTSDSPWSSMIPLSNVSQNVPNIFLVQQVNDSDSQPYNSTYWRLYIPPNPFGVCNGTVVFEAVAPS